MAHYDIDYESELRAAYHAGRRSANVHKQRRSIVARAVLQCDRLSMPPASAWRILGEIVPRATGDERTYLLRRVYPGITNVHELTPEEEQTGADAMAMLDEAIARGDLGPKVQATIAPDGRVLRLKDLGAPDLESSSPHPLTQDEDTTLAAPTVGDLESDT